MAIKCPDCGHWNEDGLFFCEECGEPIDPKTRLIMQLEKNAATPTGNNQRNIQNDDDDDITISRHQEEKKKSPIGWILLLVAAAVAYFLFLR